MSTVENQAPLVRQWVPSIAGSNARWVVVCEESDMAIQTALHVWNVVVVWVDHRGFKAISITLASGQ